METFNTSEFLRKTRFFWQYPVITEETFYNQNKDDPLFCGLPWATFLDKRIALNDIYKSIIPYIKHKNYYTCCQHISFRTLMPLFKILGITTVYTPHKIKQEDEINGIKLLPCPLYAVNIENENKNALFKDNDFLNCKRKYLYSFMGGVQTNYISTVRNDIFNKLKKISNVFIENTGEWHFNKVVYSHKQNNNHELNIDDNHKRNTRLYNKLLLNSRYSLCPSGSGPNSIRFWESLACGAIPILLADTLELPHGIEWEKAIVIMPENEITNINTYLKNISLDEEKERRYKCIEIYNLLRTNFKNI